MKYTQKKRETNRHDDMHVLGDYCYISKGMVLNSHEDSNDEEFKRLNGYHKSAVPKTPIKKVKYDTVHKRIQRTGNFIV